MSPQRRVNASMIFLGSLSSIDAISTENPLPNKVPQTIASRVYFGDTSSYDLTIALGKLGEVDKSNNTITQYIDKSHFSCDPKTALETKVKTLPQSRAFYYLFDKNYSGSLSIFTLNASLSDKERLQVSMDDVATADLDHSCQLNNRRIIEIIRLMPGASGKRIFYVTGATMSRLTKEVFSETDTGGGLSAGSWLSLDAKFYKGSTQIDAVPVISVRGYAVDVPPGVEAANSENELDNMILRPFSSVLDLGLNTASVKFERKIEPK